MQRFPSIEGSEKNDTKDIKVLKKLKRPSIESEARAEAKRLSSMSSDPSYQVIEQGVKAGGAISPSIAPSNLSKITPTPALKSLDSNIGDFILINLSQMKINEQPTSLEPKSGNKTTSK